MAQYRRKQTGPRGPKQRHQHERDSPKDKNFGVTVRAMFKFVQLLHHLNIMTNQMQGSLTQGFQTKERDLKRFIKPACPNPTIFKRLEQEARGWVLKTSEVLVGHYNERSDHFKNLVANSTLSPADFDRARQIATGWARKNFGRKLKDATLKALDDLRQVSNAGTTANDRPQPISSTAASSTKETVESQAEQTAPSSGKQVTIQTPATVSRPKRKKPSSPQSDDETSPSTRAPPNKTATKRAEFSVPVQNKFAALADLQSIGANDITTPAAATPSKRKRSELSVSPDTQVSPSAKVTRPTQSPLASPELLSQPTQSTVSTASPSSPDEVVNFSQVEDIASPHLPSGQPCQLETPSTPIEVSDSPPRMQPLLGDSDEPTVTVSDSPERPNVSYAEAAGRARSPVQVSKSPIASKKAFRPIVASNAKGKWELPPIKTTHVVLGDSNLSKITECRVKNADQVLTVCSFPGAKFVNFKDNVLNPASKKTYPGVTNVVLSLGINERDNLVTTTSGPNFKKLIAATKKVFPNADIYVPTLQWDKDLIEGGQKVDKNLTDLWECMKAHIDKCQNTYVLPPLETENFTIADVRGAAIHWTTETANLLLDKWVHHLN